jgi:hypothetical protein
MTLIHPERVAATWLRSGVPLLEPDPKRPTIRPYTIPEDALSVPILCNPGTQEGVTVKDGRFAGVWPANEAFFKAARGRGGLTGVAVDPLSSHECGNQRYLAVRWFDACLTARLPERTGEPLQKIKQNDVWLAPLLGNTAAPAAEFSGETSAAVWLPNETVARLWMQYVKDTAVPDTTPPPAPHSLKVTDNTLTWEAEADLESGLAHFVIERDGQLLATLPQEPRKGPNRSLFQGQQYSDTPLAPLVEMRFTDTTAQPGKKHQYRVIAVNTAGLRSE